MSSETINYDSLVSSLLSMGFEMEYIQQYLHTSKRDRIEPSLHDAINFLVSHQPSSSISDPIADLENNELLSNHYLIESSIPTVIGYNKSIALPVTSQTETSVNLVPKESVTGQNKEERENFYKKLKQDRESQLRHKQRIKEMIQHDRKEKRVYRPSTNNTHANTHMEPVSDTIDREKQKTMSRLSIHLLNGTVISKLFDPTDTLAFVLSCIQEECELTDITLAQAFPKIEYSIDDMTSSLDSLGFDKGGSLIVKKLGPVPDVFGRPINTSGAEGGVVPAIPPTVAQPALPLFAGLQNPHDWGNAGSTLGGDFITKSIFLKNIETKKYISRRIGPCIEIISLKELSFRILVRRAKVSDLPHLNFLSPGEGQLILARLIRENILSPKLVDMFIGCKMHTIDLTSCHLITNELLHRFTRIKSISKLVIKGSSFLTDKAVAFIADMPNLNVLILADCSNLTNTSCYSLSRLKTLKKLNLRATKVTDKGIKFLVEHEGLIYIEELILSNTSVTHAVLLPLIINCSFIKLLNLESTKVTSLPCIDGESICVSSENFKEIDFSNCYFTDDTDFSSFFKCLNLKILKLCGASITDFSFLDYLSPESISFPRVIKNANGSSPFKSLIHRDFKQLNLTNCLSLSLIDMRCIGMMHNLTELILKNCRCLQSEALESIVSLSQLRILDLEHTNLTNSSAIYIFSFLTQLIYLNLSGTQVSNLMLKSQILNRCHSLTTLNLNNTTVSNTGITFLSISYLTSLFLNGTYADENTEQILLLNCPNLKNISLRNLYADSLDNEDD